MDSFRQAAALDPGLPAANEVEHTETLLLRLSDLCKARGGLKPKRVDEFVRPLRQVMSARPPSAPAGIVDTCATLEALLEASAKGQDAAHVCLTCCRVVCMPPNPIGDVPLLFICVDADARAFVLAAYCLADGAVRGGATLSVLGPKVAQVEVALGAQKRASFVSLRVDGPSQLALQGQSNTLAADGRAHASAAPRLATHTL